jgi:hypothetical protein
MITRKFHIDIDHHNSLYDLMIEEWNKHHLPKKFNTNSYEVVKSFEGCSTINTLLLVKDVYAKGDGVYTSPHEEDPMDSTTPQF